MKALLLVLTLLSGAARAEKIDFNAMISEVESNIEQQAKSFAKDKNQNTKLREPATQSQPVEIESIKASKSTVQNEIQ